MNAFEFTVWDFILMALAVYFLSSSIEQKVWVYIGVVFCEISINTP